MLLLNGKQFVPSGSSEEHKYQREHYKESVKYIKDTYGQGGRNTMVVITRRKEQERDATGRLADTPPLIFPSKSYCEIQFAAKDEKKRDTLSGVESWAYSRDQPKRPNTGDDYAPSPKSIKFMAHFEGFNMNTQMDLIYFLLYKSAKVYYPPAIAQGKVKKGDLMVEDKGLRAKERVQKERDMLKLKNAIMAPDMTHPLHADTNLRKVAAAWGLDGAMDEYQSVDDLRIRLEHNVKEAEKTKSVTGEGKGLAEFLELIDFSNSVRQRGMIMYALDNGKVNYDEKTLRYTYAVNSGLLVDVPDKKKYHQFDYLADFLANDMHDKEWTNFKNEVVDQGYIEMLSFDDLKWLAKQNEISLNQKSAINLREDLSKIYCG